MNTPFVNAPNFRDLGGIAMRDGRVLRAGIVYRSGVLDALDDAEVARLGALGIRTVVDLRSDEEVETRPNRVPAGVETVRAPAVDVSASPRRVMELIEAGEAGDFGPSMLVQGNTQFATKYRAMFATVVRLLCDPARQPVIVQCTAGKDRTGFAVATMLWALGADHDTVVADYLRSNELLAERHGRLLDDARARGIETEALEALLVLRREYLDAGYTAACESHGSIDGWLRDGLGITDAERQIWQDAMLISSVV
ncbi:MAG TPA: tyrosine-protein phosphatase [Acidimicrobiia bacterium]